MDTQVQVTTYQQWQLLKTIKIHIILIEKKTVRRGEINMIFTILID